MNACHRCQSPWEGPGKPGFNNLCAECGMALHSCANCSHYQPRASNRCVHPKALEIRDGLAANQCPEFNFELMMSEAEAAADAGAVRARRFLQEGRDDDAKDDKKQSWDQLFDF